MDFRVANNSLQGLKRCCLLVPSDWDDWFEFETTFYMEVYDENGQGHKAGLVKIGERGLKGRRHLPGGRVQGYRYPLVPPFSQHSLPPHLFSIGQDETYYETLNQLSETLRLEILRGMRDIAFDLALFNEVATEAVTTISLLRDIPAGIVTGRLHRLANGDARLTSFNFSYTAADPRSDAPPPTLTFRVEPESFPPTNIHVLIGRNGVGKSRLMQKLAYALLARPNDPEDPFGSLIIEDTLVCHHHTLRTRLRVQRAPGIPHALCWAKDSHARLGRIAPRGREGVCLAVEN